MMLVFDEEHLLPDGFQFFFAGVPVRYFDIERQTQPYALDKPSLTHTFTCSHVFFLTLYIISQKSGNTS